jgi:hypothetical protein
MAEVVGAADLELAAVVVAQVCELDELVQLLVQGRPRVGPPIRSACAANSSSSNANSRASSGVSVQIAGGNQQRSSRYR